MKMNSSHECAGKSESTLYKIGVFAAMNHVTVKALRFYEEQGLLMPAQIQPDTGYRYYALSQMADLHRITALKKAGFGKDAWMLTRSGVQYSSCSTWMPNARAIS